MSSQQCALTVLREPEVKRLAPKIYAISKAEHLAMPIFARAPHRSINFMSSV